MAKLRMKCATCGSDNVVRDAWAEWCEVTQQWDLQNVFDYAWCIDCDGEARVEMEEVHA